MQDADRQCDTCEHYRPATGRDLSARERKENAKCAVSGKPPLYCVSERGRYGLCGPAGKQWRGVTLQLSTPAGPAVPVPGLDSYIGQDVRIGPGDVTIHPDAVPALLRGPAGPPVPVPRIDGLSNDQILGGFSNAQKDWADYLPDPMLPVPKKRGRPSIFGGSVAKQAEALTAKEQEKWLEASDASITNAEALTAKGQEEWLGRMRSRYFETTPLPVPIKKGDRLIYRRPMPVGVNQDPRGYEAWLDNEAMKRGG